MNEELARSGLAGKVSGRLVAGLVNSAGIPIQGRQHGAGIEVNPAAPDGVLGVSRHEIVHALRDASLWGQPHGPFTPEEWKELVANARADKAVMALINRDYADLDAAGRIEEAVAEKYRLRAQGEPVTPGPADGAIARVFQNIRDFLTAVATAFRGAGEPAAADVFQRIASGEIGRRSGRKQMAATSMRKYPAAKDLSSVARMVPPNARNDGGAETKILWKQDVFNGGAESRNAASGMASPADVDTDAFRSWFGASAVVDKDGNPLVVYHATNADFPAFSPKKGGSNTRDVGGSPESVKASKLGIWTNDRDVARDIGASITMPLYLSIQNPASVRLGDLLDMAKTMSARQLKAAFVRDGYDGLRVADDEFGGWSWVAFEPTQVKSIANRGTWNPDDPRIMESRMPSGPAPRDNAGRFRRATSWVRDLPLRSKVVQNFDRKTFFSDLMTDAMGGAGGGINLLSLVPLRPLLDEVGRTIHSARGFLRAKEEMDAVRNDWQARTDKTAQAWIKLNRNGKAENAAPMDLMHRSTLAGHDPSKPIDEEPYKLARSRLRQYGPESPMGIWARRTLEDEAQARDTHAQLQTEFEALPPAYRDMFRAVAAEYDAMATEFEAAVVENMRKAGAATIRRAEREHRAELRRIGDEGLTGKDRSAAIKEADGKLALAKARGGWALWSRINGLRAEFESNRLKGVYFPLSRHGNYFVIARDGTGKVVSFSKAESRAEQRRIARALESDGLAVETGVMSDRDALRSQVAPTFVADVISLLGDTPGVDHRVMDAVWQRWLETLPDQSIRTSRIHRKGRAGYDRDALRSFTNHMFHGAHQLARLKHGIDLQESVAEAEAEAAKASDPERAGLVVNELSRRLDFIMQPTNAPITARLSSLAFIWYLGATPASAVANISQTTVVGPAVMGARFTKQGVTGAATELAKAMRDVTGRILRDFDGPNGVLASKRLTDEEKDALREAVRRGTIDKTQAHDLASVAETGIEYNGRWESVMRVIGGMFHKAEVLNRTATFLADYRMARKDGLVPDTAVQAAADLTWKTHFDYQNTSRPRVMQGDWAKVFLTFRQFTVNMLFRMARDLHQSFAGESPAARKPRGAEGDPHAVHGPYPVDDGSCRNQGGLGLRDHHHASRTVLRGRG
jgi:hypothetical protein